MANNNSPLDPWYVTGFVDGEGCFSLFINTENRKRKNGLTSTYRYWVVVFAIHLRDDDRKILESVKSFFDAGSINEIARYHAVHYSVSDRKDIVNKIIPHFDKFTLRAKKNKDFLLWREAVMVLDEAKKRQKTRFDGQCLKEPEQLRLYEIKDLLSNRLSGRQHDDYVTHRGILRTGKTKS